MICLKDMISFNVASVRNTQSITLGYFLFAVDNFSYHLSFLLVSGIIFWVGFVVKPPNRFMGWSNNKVGLICERRFNVLLPLGSLMFVGRI